MAYGSLTYGLGDYKGTGLSAFFSATPTSGETPLLITFTNLSSGASAYYWDFGDLSYSTSANPTHIYESSGIYTVSLTAISGLTSGLTTRSNYISAISVCADFGYTLISGTTYQFSNSSTNALTYNWDFGDGYTSSTTNPIHIFSGSGSFNVRLSANGATTQSIKIKTVSVILTLANFNLLPYDTYGWPLCTRIGPNYFDSITSAGFYIDNLSQNESACKWDFGDGRLIDNSCHKTSSFSFGYDTPGVYTITLSAYGPLNNSIASKTVTAVDPQADFSASPLFGSNNLNVQFTNLSTGASTYLWDFGDGSFSTCANPTHTYLNNGLYSVILSATSGIGYGNEPINSIISKNDFIGVNVGHIGAFYFGPVDETVEAPIIEISAILLPPNVIIINTENTVVSPPYLSVLFNLLQPTVYSTQEINVNFVGVPRIGSSPLVVDFTATINLSPELISKYKVDTYEWCFDYDYVNNVCNIPFETSTINTISHVYTGYRGQKYSVKCCAKLKLI